MAEERREEGSLASRTHDALLERIRRGDFAPGRRLREEDLAKVLGVSRTPVREALGRLQARGLVQPVQGGLAIVEMGRGKVIELYAMRGVLEGAAARFAAENASTSDLQMIRLAHVAFCEMQSAPVREAGDPGSETQNAANFRALADGNVRFHCAIYEAAHNSYLTRMLADLNDSLALLPQTTFSVAARAAHAIDEHGEILTAIAARDADLAEQAARRHIEQALGARLTLLL